MLIARDEGRSFTPVPSGSHLARCYRIIDLGTQKTEWQGQVKLLPKVMFQFEVHGEDEDGNPLRTSKGEPMSISKNYTLWLKEKSLLKADLEAWRGKGFTQDELKGFELKNVLGAWCLLTVTRATGKDGKDYTNISGVSPVPKAMKASLPEPHNEVGIFSISDPDMEMFETFSDRIKQRIMDTPEWKSRNTTEDDSSIPF
jgi:hypothetical protein